MNLNLVLSHGNGHVTLFFNFERQLYSFVTCAGQTNESASFGIFFTVFDWKVWISLICCVFFLFGIVVFSSGIWEFSWITEMNISLILGSLGNQVSIRRDIMRKKSLVCFLVFLSFIGLIFGNLYQARLTESLILPLKYDQNLTLVDLIDQYFKILLIQFKSSNYIKDSPQEDPKTARLEYCLSSRFCRNLFLQQLLDEDNPKKSLNCSRSPWNCPHLFANGKSNILKLPQLVSMPRNFSFSVGQLSSCKKNRVFIHYRFEMYQVVKPKLPKVSRTNKREFKYSPISDHTLPITVFASMSDVENLMTPILNKYVQHGLEQTNILTNLQIP